MTRSSELIGEPVGSEHFTEQIAAQLRSAKIDAQIHGLLPEFEEMLEGILEELKSGEGQEN